MYRQGVKCSRKLDENRGARQKKVFILPKKAIHSPQSVIFGEISRLSRNGADGHSEKNS